MTPVLFSVLKMQRTSCQKALAIHILFSCSKMSHTYTSIVSELPALLTLH